MPQLTSPLSTPTGMPALNPAHLGKAAGLRIHFALFSDFTAAITTGTSSYAADLWADGQEMTIASEADSGAVRVWRTGLGHARTIKVGRLEVVLPANTNVVLAAAGIPASGTGTNGDLSVDKAAGIAYLKTAGAWASAGNIGELSAAAASAVQSAFNAGSSFTSTTLVPVAGQNSAVLCNIGLALYDTQGSENVGNTCYYKWQLEGPYDWIRVWVFSREQSRQTSEWEVIVAPTDEPLNDSQANAFYPRVAGTSYNDYAESLGNENTEAKKYGWYRGRWSSLDRYGSRSRSGPLLPAGLNSEEGTSFQSHYNALGLICTQKIYMPCVMPNNGDTKPYIVMRTTRPAKAGEGSYSSSQTNGDDYVAARNLGLPWYRKHMAVVTNSVDGVNTLATVPAAPTESTYQFRPSTVFIEVGYRAPTRAVLFMGDSVTSSGGQQLYGYGSFCNMACGTVSTPSAPMVPHNAGSSTMSSRQYLKRYDALRRAGMRFTDVVVPDWSTNDAAEYGGASSVTEYGFAKYRGRLLELIERCRADGCRVYIWTSYFGKPGTNAAGLAPYQALTEAQAEWTRGICAAGLATLVDWRAIFTAASLGLDNIHPSPQGIQDMNDLLVPALRS